MWTSFLFAALASAGTPVGVEGGLSLAMPHASLGPSPGLRILVDAEVTDTVWVGGELDGRIPGGSKVELENDLLIDPVELQTGQTVLSMGAHGAWMPGDEDGLRWRLGGALGASRLIQRVNGDAGTTVEAASSLWLRPEGGIAYALGPGHLTGSLYWSLSPTRLDTIDAAGNVLGLLVGWRMELGK